MRYATNVILVTCRTLNIFHCRVSLWKWLLNVLGVGLEYFLALALALTQVLENITAYCSRTMGKSLDFKSATITPLY